jgi:hypothetical protein
MVKLQTLKKSKAKGKKYTAIFLMPNGKTKTVNFGAKGYTDYTLSHDDERRKRYIERHKNEDWTDPTKAGTLSRYILWEEKSIVKALKNFKKKFKV